MAAGRVTRLPPYVWMLVGRLRRRGLAIGIDDCNALRAALTAGYGLDSDEALRDVCVTLWAKTSEEAALIRTAFAGSDVPQWTVAATVAEEQPGGHPVPSPPDPEEQVPTPDDPVQEVVRTREMTGEFTAPPEPGGLDPSLFVTARYPLPAREIAQVWRRLNRPSRGGSPVEVDADRTLERLGRSGIATPPVLVPRRTNRMTVLMLIDRNGSMSPYHSYIEHIRLAIATLGRLAGLTVRYFHDVPGVSTDRRAAYDRPDRLSRQLDPVITAIRPLPVLRTYYDPLLARPDRLGPAELSRHAGIVVVSDAGAARGRFDADRLVDTIALGRTLRQVPRCTAAWLNPVEPERWRGTTAEQIARHLPMVPLTRDGMTHAVDVLRGRPAVLERPL